MAQSATVNINGIPVPKRVLPIRDFVQRVIQRQEDKKAAHQQDDQAFRQSSPKRQDPKRAPNRLDDYQYRDIYSQAHNNSTQDFDLSNITSRIAKYKIPESSMNTEYSPLVKAFCMLALLWRLEYAMVSLLAEMQTRALHQRRCEAERKAKRESPSGGHEYNAWLGFGKNYQQPLIKTRVPTNANSQGRVGNQVEAAKSKREIRISAQSSQSATRSLNTDLISIPEPPCTCQQSSNGIHINLRDKCVEKVDAFRKGIIACCQTTAAGTEGARLSNTLTVHVDEFEKILLLTIEPTNSNEGRVRLRGEAKDRATSLHYAVETALANLHKDDNFGTLKPTRLSRYCAIL